MTRVFVRFYEVGDDPDYDEVEINTDIGGEFPGSIDILIGVRDDGSIYTIEPLSEIPETHGEPLETVYLYSPDYEPIGGDDE